jgi:hypothetical protein
MYDDRDDDGETTIILAFTRIGLCYLNLKGRRRRRRRERRRRKGVGREEEEEEEEVDDDDDGGDDVEEQLYSYVLKNQKYKLRDRKLIRTPQLCLL